MNGWSARLCCVARNAWQTFNSCFLNTATCLLTFGSVQRDVADVQCVQCIVPRIPPRPVQRSISFDEWRFSACFTSWLDPHSSMEVAMFFERRQGHGAWLRADHYGGVLLPCTVLMIRWAQVRAVVRVISVVYLPGARTVREVVKFRPTNHFLLRVSFYNRFFMPSWYLQRPFINCDQVKYSECCYELIFFGIVIFSILAVKANEGRSSEGRGK